MKRLVAILVIMAWVTPSFAALENLDEAVARKSRKQTNTFFSGEAVNYIWQPQSLTYSDTTTGREVWKIVNSPGVSATWQGEINTPTWSADGRRMGLKYTWSADLGVKSSAIPSLAGSSNPAFMIVNTDGSRLRPILGGPSRVSDYQQYIPWSPVLPDVYYMFGMPEWENTGVYIDSLYRADVTDTWVSRTQILSSVPELGGSGGVILNNAISPDGKKIVANQYYSTTTHPTIPVTLLPSVSKDSISWNNEDVSHDTTYWGDTPETWTTWHAGHTNLVRDWTGRYKIVPLPSGDSSHTIWGIYLTNAGGNAAPSHTTDHESPYDFGDVIPLNAANNGNNPWPNTRYWSHYVPDRWGKNVLYSSGDPLGLAIEDTITHTVSAVHSSYSNQHADWHAWSDYVVASKGPDAPGMTTYINDQIYLVKHDTINSGSTIAFTHTFANNTDNTYSGSTMEYVSLPRPAQSPDGTKVSFHSTFLNSKTGTYDNAPEAFWAVAYYPYPAFVRSVTATSGTVTITIDWDLAVTPRGYTMRGWPDESTDLPPPPREIKSFRLWKSANGSDWTAIKTIDYDIFNRYDFSDGTWTGDNQWTITDTPGDGTYYYAVTSIEHSGLESRKLSNIYSIAIDAGSGSGTQFAAYPPEPGGKTAFYTTAPDDPTGVTGTHQKSPATTAGQYTVEWTAPTNKTLIRHYNIYAQDGSLPTATQQRRIASVPATAADTSFSYIDWLGNPDGSTMYRVTAVDYQGNESGGEAGAVPGSCGSSNGLFLPSAPVTGLCSAGTPSAVSGTGPWTWTCAGSGGGSTVSCSASVLNNSSSVVPLRLGERGSITVGPEGSLKTN